MADDWTVGKDESAPMHGKDDVETLVRNRRQQRIERWIRFNRREWVR